MALRDRAIQQPRVCAANESCDRLDGPLLRAMTVLDSNPNGLYRVLACGRGPSTAFAGSVTESPAVGAAAAGRGAVVAPLGGGGLPGLSICVASAISSSGESGRRFSFSSANSGA